MKRARLAAGGALIVAGAVAAALALREPAPARVAIDDARPDPDAGVVLTGGRWDCDAAIPADAGITARAPALVPLRGGRRTVLVAFRGWPPSCVTLPAEPAGLLAWIAEPAYESLRDHDPARWAAVPQSSLAILYPDARPPRSRWPAVAGAASALFGLGLCVRSMRPGR